MTTDDEARAKARELAEAQADDAQIEGWLVAREGLDEQAAADIVASMAVELLHHRWSGQADLARRLWDMAKGVSGYDMSGSQLSCAQSLGYQHLGWSRDGKIDKLAKAVREAERQQARTKQAKRAGGPKAVSS
jgi:hypothetical protein